jgi:hypothetical protein
MRSAPSGELHRCHFDVPIQARGAVSSPRGTLWTAERVVHSRPETAPSATVPSHDLGVTELFAPPDPEPWRHLARVLADQAEALRTESRRIAAAAAGAHWYSPAARVFGARATHAAEQALHLAGGMDDAADLARRHAADLAAAAAAMAAHR